VPVPAWLDVCTRRFKHLLRRWRILAAGLTDENYRLIRATVGARCKFFTHLEALTTYLYFETWERLMAFMLRGLEIGPSARPRI
jgi:hypothetical protein